MPVEYASTSEDEYGSNRHLSKQSHARPFPATRVAQLGGSVPATPTPGGISGLRQNSREQDEYMRDWTAHSEEIARYTDESWRQHSNTLVLHRAVIFFHYLLFLGVVSCFLMVMSLKQNITQYNIQEDVYQSYIVYQDQPRPSQRPRHARQRNSRCGRRDRLRQPRSHGPRSSGSRRRTKFIFISARLGKNIVHRLENINILIYILLLR